MPRPLRWIAAAYTIIMGGVIAWAGIDHALRARANYQRATT